MAGALMLALSKIVKPYFFSSFINNQERRTGLTLMTSSDILMSDDKNLIRNKDVHTKNKTITRRV